MTAWTVLCTVSKEEAFGVNALVAPLNQTEVLIYGGKLGSKHLGGKVFSTQTNSLARTIEKKKKEKVGKYLDTGN